VVFDLVRALNTAIDAGEAGSRTWRSSDRRSSRSTHPRRALPQAGEDASAAVPAEEVDRLIAERKAARSRRDFAAADRIRQELADRGIVLEDTATGTRWKVVGKGSSQ